MRSITSIWKGNRLFYLLLLFSTVFFVYQHSTGLSWDFSVYVLNAKYMFSNGFYFEWNRPPFVPFVMGILSIFGWVAAEYLYIILVSALFAYSSKLLAEKINVDKSLFYGLLLSPFVLNTGLSVGTELLYLSFLQLALAYLDKARSAAFISLLFLTHYSNFIYTLLIFFRRHAKKIPVSFGIIILFFAPWLLYNFYLSGDPLTSVADAYAGNVKFRDYIKMPFNFSDVLDVSGYYILLFAFGIYKLGISRKFGKMDILMLAVLALSLLSYYTIPIKTSRYLFNLTLPLVYFSAVWINKLKLRRAAAIAIIIANFSLASIYFVNLENRGVYEDALSKADNCMIKSNAWPFINYLGKPSEPFPRKENMANEISNGTRIILFKRGEPDYASDKDFISSFPVINETEGYIILGNTSKCTPARKVDRTYISYLNELGYGLTPCNVLPLKWTCFTK
ncbi:MAG: hypothetical protein HYT72_05580 [Candidatus Aenigmarchaeota archaeon]|nr:hypothetical protein [Candidatus Aenigmarchaeota archaeon]